MGLFLLLLIPHFLTDRKTTNEKGKKYVEWYQPYIYPFPPRMLVICLQQNSDSQLILSPPFGFHHFWFWKYFYDWICAPSTIYTTPIHKVRSGFSIIPFTTIHDPWSTATAIFFIKTLRPCIQNIPVYFLLLTPPSFLQMLLWSVLYISIFPTMLPYP